MDLSILPQLINVATNTGIWIFLGKIDRLKQSIFLELTKSIEKVRATHQRNDVETFDNNKPKLLYKSGQLDIGLFLSSTKDNKKASIPTQLRAACRPISMYQMSVGALIKTFFTDDSIRVNKDFHKRFQSFYENLYEEFGVKNGIKDISSIKISQIIYEASNIKKYEPHVPSEHIILNETKKIFSPALSEADMFFFENCLKFYFPSFSFVEDSNLVCSSIINIHIEEKGFLSNENLITRVQQVISLKSRNNLICIIGDICTGKSTLIELAKGVEEQEKKNKSSDYKITLMKYSLNSFKTSHGLGYFDCNNLLWEDGLISSKLRSGEKKERDPNELWIHLDASPDVELNELLEHVSKSQKLVLPDRSILRLEDSVYFFLESCDLSFATPSILSTMSIVLCEKRIFTFESFLDYHVNNFYNVESSLKAKNFLSTLFQKCFEFINRIANTKGAWEQQFLIRFSKLFKLIHKKSDLALQDDHTEMNMKISVFCIIWSVELKLEGSNLQEFNSIIRSFEKSIPPHDSVFDYYIDLQIMKWQKWDENSFYNETYTLSRDYLPTHYAIGISTIARIMLEGGESTILIGDKGVGKSLSINSVIIPGLRNNYMDKIYNMIYLPKDNRFKNFKTFKAKRLQNIFSRTEIERSSILCYIDDLHIDLPYENDQLEYYELLRHMIDKHYNYLNPKFENARNFTIISELENTDDLLGNFSFNRLLRHFTKLYFGCTKDSSLHSLYNTMCNKVLSPFRENIRQKCDKIVESFFDLQGRLKQHFKFTTLTPHYIFTPKDISKIISSFKFVDPKNIDSINSFFSLWYHESIRVYQDRLISHEDVSLFNHITDQVLNENFGMSLEEVSGSELNEVLYSSLKATGDNFTGNNYYQILSFGSFKQNILEEFYAFLKEKGIHLNGFSLSFICKNICKIARILNSERDNLLLIGNKRAQKLTVDFTCHLEKIKNFDFTSKLFKTFMEFDHTLSTVASEIESENNRVVCCFSWDLLEDDQIRSYLAHLIYSQNQFIPESRIIFSKLNGLLENSVFQLSKLNPDTCLKLSKLVKVIIFTEKDSRFLYPLFRFHSRILNNITIIYEREENDTDLIDILETLHPPVEIEDKTKTNIIKFYKLCQKYCIDISKSSKFLSKQVQAPFLVFARNFNKALLTNDQNLDSKLSELRDNMKKYDSFVNIKADLENQLSIKEAQLIKNQELGQSSLINLMTKKFTLNEQISKIETERLRLEQNSKVLSELETLIESLQQKNSSVLSDVRSLIDKIDRKSTSELKSVSQIPEPITKLNYALQVILDKTSTIIPMKSDYNDTPFINKLKNIDLRSLKPTTFLKLDRYLEDPLLNSTNVQKISSNAGIILQWMHMVKTFFNINNEIKSTQDKISEILRDGMSHQELNKMIELRDTQQNNLEKLQADYEVNNLEKQKLEISTEQTHKKMRAIEEFLSSFEEQHISWQAKIENHEQNSFSLIGDCYLFAAFITFAPPLNTYLRAKMLLECKKILKELGVAFNLDFSVQSHTLAKGEFSFSRQQNIYSSKNILENKAIISFSSHQTILVVDKLDLGGQLIDELVDSTYQRIDDLDKHFSELLNNPTGSNLYIRLNTEKYLSTVYMFLQTLPSTNHQSELNSSGSGTSTSRNNSNHLKIVLHTTSSIERFKNWSLNDLLVVDASFDTEFLTRIIINMTLEESKIDFKSRYFKYLNDLEHLIEESSNLENHFTTTFKEAELSQIESLEFINLIKIKLMTFKKTQKNIMEIQWNIQKLVEHSELISSLSRYVAESYHLITSFEALNKFYKFSWTRHMEMFKEFLVVQLKKSGINLFSKEQNTQTLKYNFLLELYKTYSQRISQGHRTLLSFALSIFSISLDNKISSSQLKYLLDQNSEAISIPHFRALQPEWLSKTNWERIVNFKTVFDQEGFVLDFLRSTRDWKAWCNNKGTNNSFILPGSFEQRLTEFHKLCLTRFLKPEQFERRSKQFISEVMGPKFNDSQSQDIRKLIVNSPPSIPTLILSQYGYKIPEALLESFQKQDWDVKLLYLTKSDISEFQSIFTKCTQEGKVLIIDELHLCYKQFPFIEQIIFELLKKPLNEKFKLIICCAMVDFYPGILLSRCNVAMYEKNEIHEAKQLIQSVDQEYNFTAKDNQMQQFYNALYIYQAHFVEVKLKNKIPNRIQFDPDNSTIKMILQFIKASPKQGLSILKLKKDIIKAMYGHQFENLRDTEIQCAKFEDILSLTNNFNSLNDKGRTHEVLSTIDKLGSFFRESTADRLALSKRSHTSSTIQDLSIIFNPSETVEWKSITLKDLNNNDIQQMLLNLQTLLKHIQITPHEEIEFNNKIQGNYLYNFIYRENSLQKELLKLVESTITNFTQVLISCNKLKQSDLSQIQDLLSGQVPENWKTSHAVISNNDTNNWLKKLQRSKCYIAHCLKTIQNETMNIFSLKYFSQPTSFLKFLYKHTIEDSPSIIKKNIIMEIWNGRDAFSEGTILLEGIYLEGAEWNELTNALTDEIEASRSNCLPPLKCNFFQEGIEKFKNYYCCPLYCFSRENCTYNQPLCEILLNPGDKPLTYWTRRDVIAILDN